MYYMRLLRDMTGELPSSSLKIGKKKNVIQVVTCICYIGRYIFLSTNYLVLPGILLMGFKLEKYSLQYIFIELLYSAQI